MKVAAYQAPLAACASAEVSSLIRQQVDRCEAIGVELLCCPEALLGGLADYVDQPRRIAIDTSADGLDRVLAPLASDRVTTVLGFTEQGADGHLYNSAAVFARGTVVGIYRKVHPAINRSVYRAGTEAPVFRVGNVTFGVLICRDSLFPASARLMLSRGVQVLLVPTNNGMPLAKGGSEIVVDARRCDVRRASESGMPVVRADVAGVDDGLVSYGSSGIVNRDGRVVCTARAMDADLLVADVDIRLSARERLEGVPSRLKDHGRVQRTV